MKEYTIKETLEQKEKLEKTLENAIASFEKETGATVSDICFSRITHRDCNDKVFLSTFTLETVVTI